MEPLTRPEVKNDQTRLSGRSIVAGTIGNTIEYYDWYVYSAFSIYFAKTFFPQGNPTAQLLNAAAVFAVGFIMRPIGGWLLGLYADRHGRKSALLLSVLAMCLGSVMIGLTPGYATIGVAAPVILVIARLIQGFSLGGEYASSATYISEMASAKTRGLYTSLVFATLSVGQLLALLVLVALQQYFLSPHELEQWGWRIPFILGAGLSVMALYLRGTMSETPSWQRHSPSLEQKPNSTVAELLKHQRACWTVVGLTLGGSVSFYAYTTYMQKFLINTAGMAKDQATLISAISLVGFIALQPILGALSDRIGRRPLLLAFGILGSTCTVSLFSALAQTKTTISALVLLSAGLFIVSLYSSVSAIAKAEIFPVHVRALGVGLPYAITVALFGGSAEYVALSLKALGHENYFYWYVSATIAISLITYLIASEPQKISLMDKA